MASSYYDYNAQRQEGPPLPLHLCGFLLVLLLSMAVSWYLSYEPPWEGLLDQLKLAVALSPLLLLLAVHWLSGAEPGRWLPLPVPLPERESLHRAGGTPWGVALVLLLLMVMVSYQSYFHERWFPFLSR